MPHPESKELERNTSLYMYIIEHKTKLLRGRWGGGVAFPCPEKP